MKNRLNLNIKVFEENMENARKAFVLNSSLESSAYASTFIGDKDPTSSETLKNAKKVLKNKSKLFSSLLWSNAGNAVIATVARSEDPEYTIEQLTLIHKMLNKLFMDSDYLVLAATMIYNSCKPSEYESIVRKTREIFLAVRKDHPFITGSEDITNCVLMALASIDPKISAANCEANFNALKSVFSGSNKIQYMAGILTVFDGDPLEKAKKVRKVSDMFKARNFRFDSISHSAVAAIAMIADDYELEEVVDTIAATSDLLKKVRGMGALGVGKDIRTLIAMAMVIDAYTNGSDSKIKDSAMSAIVSAIIEAEEAAIAAAIAASSAAASSSS